MKNRTTKLQSMKRASFYPSITHGGATMKSDMRKRFLSVALLVTAILALVVAVAIGAEEIPWGGPTSLPDYIGEAVEAQPLPPVGSPQNPFMGPNPWNHDHNDMWMSDTYDIAGPLGLDPMVWSTTMAEARLDPNSPVFMCPGATADSQGRLILSCTGPGEWSLVLVDPVTLEVLAYEYLPFPPNLLRAFSASYLYVDNYDRAVVPVVEEHGNQQRVTIRVYQVVGPDRNLRFKKVSEYDVSSYVEEGDNINGVLPDWQGRIWFVVRNKATVGVVDPATGSIATLVLKGPDENSVEAITNSFAMAQDAAYIVTTKAMYRIELGADGVLRAVWRAEYQNIGTTKPGQITPGSGTTPTILGGGQYVAITDNADQLHVVVYRTALQQNPKDQIVCEVPVFKKGHGADENSLIGSGLTLIAYNCYGYDLYTVFDQFKALPNEPGIARVDIKPNGEGCKLVWENDEVQVIDAAQKMSTATGLVYAVTRKWEVQADNPDPGLDVYYFSAIDVRTGKVAWEQLLGTGFGFDGFALMVIGSTGTAYIPQYGGLIAIRDRN